MERKIQITLERQDYISLFVLLMNKRLTLLASIPLLIAIPVGAALIGYLANQSGLSLAMILLPYLGLILIFVAIFLNVLVSPAVRQFKEAQRTFGNQFVFLLSSEGFVCTGGSNQIEHAYARLDKALETKKYIFLFVNGGQACIFPKRLLNEADLAFLQDVLPKCATIKPEELANELGGSDHETANRSDAPDDPPT